MGQIIAPQEINNGSYPVLPYHSVLTTDEDNIPEMPRNPYPELPEVKDPMIAAPKKEGNVFKVVERASYSHECQYCGLKCDAIAKSSPSILMFVFWGAILFFLQCFTICLLCCVWPILPDMYDYEFKCSACHRIVATNRF